LGVRLRTAVAGTCFVALMVAAPSAHATYPGANGKIAYSIGHQIRTINPDGSDDTALTGTSCGYDTPSWSPDGTKIAFRACGDIHVANADGSGDTQVTHMCCLAQFPSWSPDGTKIVFEHILGTFDPEAPDTINIYVINVDGTGLTQLTTDGQSRAPDWSPTGTKIAFSGHGIYTMNPDGSAQRYLTDGFGSSWSPDGQQLAIARYSGPAGPDNIYKINTDGTDLTQLTTSTEHAFAPAWSPDGTKIVYVQDVNRSPTTLVVMNADGSGQTPLSTRSFLTAPAWQPIPNRPPDCSGVGASRSVLSTANQRLVPITLDGATDPDGDAVTLSVDGVTQDEPVVGGGDNTSPDAVDQGDGQLRVRAERNPHGDGRVYRIAFTASDGHGGSCSGTATVSVPRKKRKPAVDSAPPSYDSLVR
jgi:dipeptidyl aminopeptidase/acylaminoacyl peptidase